MQDKSKGAKSSSTQKSNQSFLELIDTPRKQSTKTIRTEYDKKQIDLLWIQHYEQKGFFCQ